MGFFGAIAKGFEAIGKGVVNTVTAPVRMTASAIQGDWDGVYNALKDVPLVSDGIDIAEGIKEGDFAKIGMGIGGLVVSAATAGSGGVATNMAKNAGKNIAKAASKDGFRAGMKAGAKSLKTQMKKQGKKRLKSEVKNQAKHELNTEGKIIVACLLLEEPKVLETIIRVFYKAGAAAGKAGAAAGPAVLDAIHFAVKNNPGALISMATAETFARVALKIYEERKAAKRSKKRKCVYDHGASERIMESLMTGVKRLAKLKLEAGLLTFVVAIKGGASKFKQLVAADTKEAKREFQKHLQVVKRISGRAGQFLDSITFEYTNGQSSTVGDKRGGVPWNGTFDLSKGEYLVAVKLKTSGVYLGNKVQFFTNKGRTYEMKGTASDGLPDKGPDKETLYDTTYGVAIIGLQERLKGVVPGVVLYN